MRSAASPRARVTPTGGGPEAQLCVREPPETVVSPNKPGVNVEVGGLGTPSSDHTANLRARACAANAVAGFWGKRAV